MQVTLMKSKIHNVVITDAKLDYVGSITIDENLMDAVGLLPGEKVLVVNNNTGARLETYTIKGKRGSGVICLNGAAAHHFKRGQQAIIIAFGIYDYSKIVTYSSNDMGMVATNRQRGMVIFPYDNNTKWRTPEEVTKNIIRNKADLNFSEEEVDELALQMAFTYYEIITFINQVRNENN